VPDHAVSRQLAARAVATIGGNPFYLQLAMFFEAELARVVGRSAQALAIRASIYKPMRTDGRDRGRRGASLVDGPLRGATRPACPELGRMRLGE
jgi:hypothetical protein